MDTAQYKDALTRERAVVEEELRGLGVHDPENSKDWVATPDGEGGAEADENVSADRAEDLEEREAILADLETRYNAINIALEKIAGGTYGHCEVCDTPVEAARLDANPAARTCIAHKDEESELSL